MLFLKGNEETCKEVLERKERIDFKIVTEKCYWDFEAEEWVFFASELKEQGGVYHA